MLHGAKGGGRYQTRKFQRCGSVSLRFFAERPLASRKILNA
jgi:hypothetical protein